MFGVAGIAAAVLAVAIYAQAVASPSEEIMELEIPFSVDLDQRDFEIEKGKTLKKAVLVESQKDAEFDLNLEVYPYEEDGAGNVSMEPKDKSPEVKLDKVKVKISKESKKVKDLAPGAEMKESGASITITVPIDAAPGTYTYVVEGKSPPDADGVVSVAGKLFTVTVK